jgi:hypothetical protein
MGSGHALNMIRVLKSNRSWIQKRKPYKEIREMYQDNLAIHHIDFKKATPEQLARIKENLILYNKRRTRKSIILISTILIIVLIFAYLVLAKNIFNF